MNHHPKNLPLTVLLISKTSFISSNKPNTYIKYVCIYEKILSPPYLQILERKENRNRKV